MGSKETITGEHLIKFTEAYYSCVPTNFFTSICRPYLEISVKYLNKYFMIAPRLKEDVHLVDDSGGKVHS